MNKRMIALGAVGALLGMSACFAEDAYIESDGTQAIDTRYKLKSTTRIEIDFQFTSVYGQNSVFGNYTGNDLGVRFYVGGATDTPANWSFVYGYKSASEDPGWYNIVHCDTERHTAMIDFAGKTAEFDDRMGTLDASVIRDDVESSLTLSVFGQKYSNGTISLIPKMKLYSFRIYESGTPVLDYVPCLRDGVAGLYDKVGKTFVANYKPAETGFSYGGDIMTISDTDAYIESNGKTLVNLLERFGPNTRYEVDFKLNSASGTQYIAGSGDDPVTYSLFYVGVGYFKFYVGDTTKSGGGGGNAYPTSVAADTRRHIGVLDRANNTAYLVTDGAKHGTVTLPTSGVGSTQRRSTTRLTAFDDSKVDVGLDIALKQFPANMRLYGVKIFEDGVLVRNYKPVRQAGIVGLKDSVKGTFVTALKPSTLTSGGNIPDVPDDAYLSMLGENGSYDGRYFNTDLYPPATWARIEIDYAMEKPYESGTSWYLCSGADKAGSYHDRYLCRFDGSTMKWLLGPSGDWMTLEMSSDYANVRRTSIIDIKNRCISLVTAGVTNKTAVSSNYDGGNFSQNSLKIGAIWDGASGFAPVRFYEIRVYSNDIPFRCWKPYVTDGVPVMRDVVTVRDIQYRGKGVLKSVKAATKSFGYHMTVGGTVESDRAGNAYLESDGTQAIDTGYTVKPTTKIEVDYQYTNVVGQSRVFGVNVSGSLAAEFYTGGTDGSAGANCSFFYGTNGKSSSNIIESDVSRHTAVLDLANRTYSLAGKSGSLDESATIEGESGAPLILFARTIVASGAPDHPSIIRLYSCRIYESGELVHEYLPYKDGTTVGLKDSVTGDIFEDVKGSDSAFKVGGCGCDEKGTLIRTSPQDVEVAVEGESKLSVFAPGAIGYQWYRNGEVIDGATAATYDVPWEKLPKPRTVTYTVKAKFDRYGVTVESESEPVTATMGPLGSVIFLR